MIGALGFTAPWLLLGLLALPILWIILRAVPPAPVRRMFPGVVLLLGLKDEEQVSDRTPWWLLLLRMLAVAAVIIAMAGPILNPETRDQSSTDAPLLVVMDASWASAPDWRAKIASLEDRLAQAGRDGRPAALLRLTDPSEVAFQATGTLVSRLTGITPDPWQPTDEMIDQAITLLPEDAFDTIWFSDGIARDNRKPLLDALEDKGSVTVFESPRSLYGLEPATFEDGAVQLTARRLRPGAEQTITVQAIGPDPSGVETTLARQDLTFAQDVLDARGSLELPAELRARIQRFTIAGSRGAGAVSLPDDTLRRREVALIASSQNREGLELLSPTHYLERALEPTADLIEGGIADILPANPDVIVFADVATVGPGEEEMLLDWLDNGGMLLRFAGPRLAASDVSRGEEDALMPVRLRAGGRTVGGAMSWGEPKSLAPFDAESPFFGLTIPEDVTVTSQVMAQPDPTLASRVVAQLTDGTPLVTRKRVGQGQIVLFHVTANAEWSNLPLSGLFVRMLERLAVSSITATPEASELAGTTWQPAKVLDGFGQLRDAKNLPGIAGEDLVTAALGPNLRPGLYQGEDRSLARNVVTSDTELTPTEWPDRIPVEGLSTSREVPLAGWLLALTMVLLFADVIASLALSGKLRGARAASMAIAALAFVLAAPHSGIAQTDERTAIEATSELRLAHVLTGDDNLDGLAGAGLKGLSEVLYFRTSIEPAAPMGVNLETDELAFFPLLYWPVTPDQPTPSAEAYAKLNTYLRTGGMILFDTRDADIASFGASSPNGKKLQALAAPLDIPPLEPLPQDHVLTRAFYLLQDFPGRYTGRDIWVEAAPPDAAIVEGMPFRNLNDNVTPVIIGGNDWIGAWATNASGMPLNRIGSGFAGERQREIAYRFGVNLVMHVLTGNYKSDQVHVPALLDRLGQ